MNDQFQPLAILDTPPLPGTPPAPDALALPDPERVNCTIAAPGDLCITLSPGSPNTPMLLGSLGSQFGGGPAWIIILVLAVLIIAFVVVPLLKGIGWLIGGVFRGIGWLVKHIFEFVAGVVGDLARAVGALVTAVVLIPMILGTVVIGRWSASAHYGRALQDEIRNFGYCLFRVAISHPARFVLLGGLTEGVERRLPQAVAQAPGSDRPSKRVGTFDGYTIVGSLPTGGSGGKLYIADPGKAKLASFARAGITNVTQVVIKSFSLADGSTMPQIVRESRALEAARKLGLVLDHDLTDSRFYYVMPYVPGDSLTLVTKRLHAMAGVDGLHGKTLNDALTYTADLLSELDYYHRGGMWHKDVKPDNIIVADNKAHLVDLGLVTPLRSAMTLTTHGTEYFRDPELVRMALRGAKVNEVDGVKFDIYGVGAVLYSVIENSFPAHGALSQISRRCPEALRWVIRRSMAEMSQRYASAGLMLADIRAILAAPDPFALKPIDLPSMSGETVAPVLEPAIDQTVYARTPTPPPIPDWARQGAGVAAGLGGAAAMAGAGVGAAAGAVPVGAVGAGARAAGFGAAGADLGGNGPAAPAPGRTRPKLTLTDWWRGKYNVAGQTPVPPSGRAAAGAGPRVDRVVDRAGRGAHGGSRSAADQLASARARVQQAQERIRGRGFTIGARINGARRLPTAARYRNNPNGGVWAAVGIALLFVFLVFNMRSHSTSRSSGSGAGVAGSIEPLISGGEEIAVDGVDQSIVQGVIGNEDADPESIAASSGSNDWSIGIVRNKRTGRAELAVPDQAVQFERKLNAFVADLESRVRSRGAGRSVTARDYGAALSETVAAWVHGSGNGETTESTGASPAPAQAAALPQPPVSPAPPMPLAPGAPDAAPAAPAGAPVVVIASFIPSQARDSRSERLEHITSMLTDAGYEVLGLGASEADIALAAGVRTEINLSSPTDPEAVTRVRSWLGAHHPATSAADAPALNTEAVLWVPSDPALTWRLITRDGLSKAEGARLVKAMKD